MPPAARGQLAIRLEEPGGDHGHDGRALGRGAGRDERLEAEALHGGADSLHVAMVGGSHHLEELVDGGQGVASQQAVQQLDPLRGPLAEIGQGAVLDLPALSVPLAQQNGRRRAAIGHGSDIHAKNIPDPFQFF